MPSDNNLKLKQFKLQILKNSKINEYLIINHHKVIQKRIVR